MTKYFLCLFLMLTFISCSEDSSTDIPEEEAIVKGTIDKTLSHNGDERTYILHIPEVYTGEEEVSLVLNFHGYGSNALDQMRYGDFRDIADREGFIVAHPQGLEFNGTTHWNVGGWTVGSTVDDLGFVDVLIDEISSNYNINPSRIYATGMSNGGYFSFLLACQLSNQIAAIASVTGSMTPENLAFCDPQRPVPIMQIHGTDDGLVLYDGTSWSASLNDVVQYWIEVNDLNTMPVVNKLLDTDTSDGSTVERYQFGQGDPISTVIHYRIEGGAHTWPGTIFNTPGTNYDIDASEVIWEFFDEYDKGGRR